MRLIIFTFFFLLNVGFLSAQWKVVFDGAGACSYVDSLTGKTIKGEYSNCSPFIGNEALVQFKGDYCLIDNSGELLYKFNYREMYQMKAGEFSFFQDTIAGTVNSKGEILSKITFKNYHISGIVEELFILESKPYYGIFSKKKGILLPVEYEVDDFMKTFSWDGNLYFREGTLFSFKHNGKWGLTDTYGKVLVPFEYDKLNVFDSLVGANKNGKWGLVNKDQHVVLPMEYDYVFVLYNFGTTTSRIEDPYIFLKDDKIVFYNVYSKKIVSTVPEGKYEWERPDNLVLNYNGKYGVIDYNGAFVVPLEYEGIKETIKLDTAIKQHVFEVRKNKSWALYKSNIGLITSFIECDKLNSCYFEGKLFCLVKKKENIFIYDENLKLLSPTAFDGFDFNDGYITVYKGSKTGFLNSKGIVEGL